MSDEHGVEVARIAGNFFTNPFVLVESLVFALEFDFCNYEAFVHTEEFVDFPN